jgi:ABC-type antimicrobial peptide transport system permease subunit
VNEEAARRALRRDLDAFPLVAPAAPTDLTSFGRVSMLPLALGAVMLVVTIAVLGHFLVTSIRRRRRDFAILEVLGFVGRQRSLAIATQATTCVSVALLIGFPVGIWLGRWGWGAIAHELGVPSEPTTDWALIALIGVGLLVTANVVAVVPAWLARRGRAASALRTH